MASEDMAECDRMRKKRRVLIYVMGALHELVGFSVVRGAKRQIRCGLKRPKMEKSVRFQESSNWLKLFGVKDYNEWYI